MVSKRVAFKLVSTLAPLYPAVTVLGEEALEGALVAAGGVNADGTVVGGGAELNPFAPPMACLKGARFHPM